MVSLYCMAPALSVYCIVMVVWSDSVVSLLYEAIYSSVSCARLRRVLESLLVLYDCLLQIIIVEFQHFRRGDWVTHNESCQRWAHGMTVYQP